MLDVKEISYSLYSLDPVSTSAKHISNSGMLLKFLFEDDSVGFSLYHPIKSLGDPSVEKFINYLKFYKSGEAVDRIKETALLVKDFMAKPETEKTVKCYFSCPSIEFFKNKISDIVQNGFNCVKLKVSNVADCKKIFEISGQNLKSILDFNIRMSSVEDFKKLSDFSDQVKYVEDPVAPDMAKDFVNESGVQIGSDFIDYGSNANYKILKPTSFFRTNIESTGKKIVTSYLDHPLGQMISALTVDDKAEQQHGLLTHDYYKKNQYSDCIKTIGNRLRLSSLVEICELLEKEKWTLISF